MRNPTVLEATTTLRNAGYRVWQGLNDGYRLHVVNKDYIEVGLLVPYKNKVDGKEVARLVEAA